MCMASTTTPGTSKEALLRRIAQGYRALRSSLEALPRERFGEKLSTGWSLNENLLHLAAWEETVPPRVAGVLSRGEDPKLYDEIDSFNARVAAESRGKSTDELFARWSAAHERVLETVRQLSDDGRRRHRPLQCGGRRANAGPRWRRRPARARRGTPRPRGRGREAHARTAPRQRRLGDHRRRRQQLRALRRASRRALCRRAAKARRAAGEDARGLASIPECRGPRRAHSSLRQNALRLDVQRDARPRRELDRKDRTGAAGPASRQTYRGSPRRRR